MRSIIALIADIVGFISASCPFMQKSLEESNFFYEGVVRTEDRLRKDNLEVLEPQPAWSFFFEYSLPQTFIEEFQNSSILILAEQYYDQKYLSGIQGPQLSLKEKIKKIESLTHCLPQEKRCKPKPICDPKQKYRTIDGTCNNLNNPNIGAIHTQYNRFLQAVFNDGLNELRRNSITSAPLKSPRDVGNVIFSRKNYITKPNPVISLGAVIFGQVIAHDVGNVINTGTGRGGSSLSCCSADYTVPMPKHLSGVGCNPISIPRNDPYFSKFNMTCMEFIRAQTIFKNDCKLGQAQKTTITTSYLDASVFYGHTLKLSYELRSFKHGKFRMDKENILYRQPNCTAFCYLTGDARQINNPVLLMQSSLFARFHNFLAQELSTLNRNWDDETLYQEARRILIAIYQHIVIDEWLRLIIGEEYYNKNFACKANSESCGQYKESVNGGTFGDFSSAGLRYFHALIPDWVDFYSNSTNWYSRNMMSDLLNNENILEPHYLGIVRGSVFQEAWFHGFPIQLRNHAFKGYKGFGMDVSSIDLARGRDFGLPPYYMYMEYCEPNIKKVKTWNDLEQNIAPDDIVALKQVYDDVHDVDLSVGMYLERKNGYIGAVARCIIGEQFYRYIYGDRFFYRHKNSANPFTEAQLSVINGINYARVICQISGVEEVPENAFLVLSEINKLVKCKDMPKISLKLWKK